MKERFTSYSTYLEEKYGGKTYRVSVDAGFSCPNRGPDRSGGGCVFCDVFGARSPYLGSLDSLQDQIVGGIGFLRKRYRAEHFILYFQAYSGTYAPSEELRRLYDYGLSLGDFRELVVSTRPDCIDAEKAELLAGYRRPGREVWVELGLQSGHPDTLSRIRRGHGIGEFEEAFGLLRGAGVKIAVHLIFGLPGEGEGEILSTVRYVAGHRPEGVKIHNLHIPRNSPIFSEFASGELSLPCEERHLGYVIRALEILPPETVIMRLTCDTPRGRLAFPRNFSDKGSFLRRLRLALETEDTRQGRLFSGPIAPPPSIHPRP